jgi:hypothetical protein
MCVCGHPFPYSLCSFSHAGSLRADHPIPRRCYHPAGCYLACCTTFCCQCGRGSRGLSGFPRTLKRSRLCCLPAPPLAFKRVHCFGRDSTPFRAAKASVSEPDVFHVKSVGQCSGAHADRCIQDELPGTAGSNHEICCKGHLCRTPCAPLTHILGFRKDGMPLHSHVEPFAFAPLLQAHGNSISHPQTELGHTLCRVL